jgi:hypothetical protein
VPERRVAIEIDSDGFRFERKARSLLAVSVDPRLDGMAKNTPTLRNEYDDTSFCSISTLTERRSGVFSNCKATPWRDGYEV